nr:MAG TPA: hypothetical protein [Caudoviricetes sp.]
MDPAPALLPRRLKAGAVYFSAPALRGRTCPRSGPVQILIFRRLP